MVVFFVKTGSFHVAKSGSFHVALTLASHNEMNDQTDHKNKKAPNFFEA
jgi:hypothetical protein